MATTWQGGSSGNWSDSSNWTSGTPSSSTYGTAVIDTPSDMTILLAANTSGISTLEIGANITFQSSSTATQVISADASVEFTAATTITLDNITISATKITLDAAGTSTIVGGSVSLQSDVTIASGQTLELSGTKLATQAGFSGSGTLLLSGSTVTLSGGNISCNVTFDHTASTGSTVDLGSGTIAKITDFGYGDKISYQNYSGTSGLAVHLVSNDDGTYSLETSWNSVICADVTLQAGTDINDYQMSSDGYFYYTGAAPCFMAGTRLATPEGQLAVENITEGTLLRTADGRTMAVRWVGRSTVSRRFGNPMEVLPIRIRAGALGENLPVRDLLVSPGHALFLDGVLVQAGALVNGVSIVREHDVPELFTYYHIELASHELLLAEGAPAESFVDNVERTHFQNWAERTGTENEPAMVELPYPRALSSRQVPLALHARLEERARLFGAAAAA